MIKHTTKQSESTCQSIDSINKQETINNKPLNNKQEPCGNFVIIGNERVFDIIKSLNENYGMQYEALKMNQGIRDFELNKWFSDNAGMSFTSHKHVVNSFLKTKRAGEHKPFEKQYGIVPDTKPLPKFGV